MEEGCFYIIAALVVIGICIALFIYVVLPISGFVLFGIGAAGAISGIGVALYNFQQLFIEAHKTIS